MRPLLLALCTLVSTSAVGAQDTPLVLRGGMLFDSVGDVLVPNPGLLIAKL